MEAPPTPLDILLVEDSLADARMAREALREARVESRLYVATNGEAALTFLRDPKRPRPHVVLLDLNLPVKGGREVLAELQADPLLCDLVVVVFSGSRAEEDRIAALRLKAHRYVRKPTTFKEYLEVMRSLAGLRPRKVDKTA
jgi:two-component system response regulator